jgi:hypothetical protein
MKGKVLQKLAEYINECERKAFFAGDPSLGLDNDWLADGSEHIPKLRELLR